MEENVFGLNHAQQKTLSDWQNTLPVSRAADGAQFEYHFTVSKDEVTCIAECHISKKKLVLGNMTPDGGLRFTGSSQLFSELSCMSDAQKEALDALLKVFPDAKRIYSFLPTGLGVICTFSINATDYGAW